MARKKRIKSEQDSEGSEFKYDIPNILLDFMYKLLPSGDELEGVEFDIEELMSKAVFICATSWNISVLPKDCANVFVGMLERVYKENDSHDDWDELHEDIMARAADMKDMYPCGDCVITGNELKALPDGQMSFDIDVIPLNEAIALMRENK